MLVVDGSIPLKDNGIYCMVAGEPIVDHIRKAAEGAAAIIAIGSCSALGGVAAAGVNPTGAVSLQEFCQAKPLSIFRAARRTRTTSSRPLRTSSLTANRRNWMTKSSDLRLWPSDSRTLRTSPHFDAGRFAKEFGDEGHREGWCLYHLGCKGPETGNCSTLQFCDVGGVWPVAIGHPCYGCNEEGIGFHKGIHQLANVENQTPRSQKPDVNAKEGGNVSAGAIGLLGGVVGSLPVSA